VKGSESHRRELVVESLIRVAGFSAIFFVALIFLFLLWLASIVADRSPKAWLAFGAVATAIVILVHRLALLPLGVIRPVRWTDLALSVAATALWCFVVGWIRSLDLPKRWRARRARTLR